jgi:hypothetical protein
MAEAKLIHYMCLLSGMMWVEGRRGSRPTAPWQAVQAIEKHDVTHRCPDW